MKSWLYYLVLLIVLGATGCTPRYAAYRSRYSFHSPDGNPDYRQLDYWAAHPWKKDPSDSIPRPLVGEPADSSVDVFFLHPTTFTQHKYRHLLNADIDDPFLNAKTDYSSILYQASVFNASARVFAPRYRQAHIRRFFDKDSSKNNRAFRLAYADIVQAFDYYLEHWNNGRPFVLAAHSQGSLHTLRLLKERVEGRPVAGRMVVAYLAGWPLPGSFFQTLSPCKDSLETGCLCSWRTFRKGYLPRYLRGKKDSALATNPLNWTIGNDYAPATVNRGSLLKDFNKLYPHTTGAKAEKGVLFVRKPRFPWGFLYFTRNYHVADINLFYLSIRENVRTRIRQHAKTGSASQQP